MPSVLFKNCFLTINSTDVAGKIDSVKFNVDYGVVDRTLNASNSKHNINTLKNVTFEVTFEQDFTATTGVDALVAAWESQIASAGYVAIEFRPVNTTVSASNPKWTGNFIMRSYDIFGQKVGDVVYTTIPFALYSGDFTRATA